MRHMAQSTIQTACASQNREVTPKITTTGRSSGPPLLSTQASAPKNTAGVTQAASREMRITRRLRLVDRMAASLAGLKGGCPGSGGSGASGGSAPV